MHEIDLALDQIEKSEGSACLITISLQKLFSAGMDLKYSERFTHPNEFKYLIIQFVHLSGRIAELSIPTIAFVKGSAIAGGCIFSFAHDYIYVQEKALFVCNEVNIGLPIPPGAMAIVKAKH